jgi:hypothetical protein
MRKLKFRERRNSFKKIKFLIKDIFNRKGIVNGTIPKRDMAFTGISFFEKKNFYSRYK